MVGSGDDLPGSAHLTFAPALPPAAPALPPRYFYVFVCKLMLRHGMIGLH